MDCRKTTGPQEGDFSIVSIEKRPWLAAGVVTYTSEKEIKILLERYLFIFISVKIKKSTT